jgi:hypothetical protein
MYNQNISKIFLHLLIILFISVSCKTQKNYLGSVSFKKDYQNKELDALGDLLWSRNADSAIKINKKNLRYIYRNTKTGEDIHFRFLDNYSTYLTLSKPIPKELSFEENVYVSAYLVEYLYKCDTKFKDEDVFKNTKWVNTFLAPRIANKYNREFKKHDYYGLKLLKKHHLEHFWEYPEQDTVPSIKRIIE